MSPMLVYRLVAPSEPENERVTTGVKPLVLLAFLRLAQP
jgi:hypothetical protein